MVGFAAVLAADGQMGEGLPEGDGITSVTGVGGEDDEVRGLNDVEDLFRAERARHWVRGGWHRVEASVDTCRCTAKGALVCLNGARGRGGERRASNGDHCGPCVQASLDAPRGSHCPPGRPL